MPPLTQDFTSHCPRTPSSPTKATFTLIVGEKGQFKVLRGGLYQTHLVIRFSATWARNYLEPTARYNFVGFRCAQDIG